MKIRKVFATILESHTHLIPVIGVLTLAIAIPLTITLIGQTQDNRQRAAAPASIQQQTGIPASTCGDIAGSECLQENSQQPDFVCFGTQEVTCANAGEICCVKKNISVENSTCLDDGKSCSYPYRDLAECESVHGTGECSIFPELHCVNQNICFDVATGSATPSDPEPTYVPQGQPCPDGTSNFSCGFGTPDTKCPVCSPTSACTSNNYSIASCSSGQACTVDSDCAGLPSSCPAGTTGSVACRQGICQTINCQ